MQELTGDPLDEKVKQGPLVSEKQLDKACALCMHAHAVHAVHSAAALRTKRLGAGKGSMHERASTAFGLCVGPSMRTLPSPP